MPREKVHWIAATQVEAKLLDRGLLSIAELFETERASILFGAIAHDAPYYYRFGKHEFESVAETLHGRGGEDTLEVFRKLSQAISDEQDPRRANGGWAFLFGMLSHYAVDAHFHPAVCYFTGDYDDPHPKRKKIARSQHRLFEVYLDQWCKFSRYRVPDRTAVQLLQALEDRGRYYGAILSKCIEPSDYPADAWYDSFRYIAYSQWACLSPVVGLPLRILRKLLKSSFCELDSLSSYRREYAHPFFNQPLRFQNSVTAEWREKSVEALFNDSLGELLELAVEVEEVMNGKRAPKELFKGRYGKSLSYGIPRVRSENATYFATEPPPLPGM